MTLGDIVKAYRNERNLSQRQFAQRADLSNGYIAMLERNENPKTKQPIIPTLPAIKKIANVIGVSVNDLIAQLDDILVSLEDDHPLPPEIIPISQMPTQRIPLIGEVAAGVPILAEEDYEAYIDIDCPSKADYALRVCGDSMEPTYLNGDVIYIRQQPTVDDGQIAVVLIDDSATLKHVFRNSYGIMLVSDNLKYPPMQFTPDDCDSVRVLGIVVGFTRMYGKSR